MITLLDYVKEVSNMKKFASKKVTQLFMVIILVIVAVILTSLVKNAIDERKDLSIDPGNSSVNYQNTVSITFPEGYTVTQIAKLLEEKNVCSADSFLDAVDNPSEEILDKFGIKNKDSRIFTLEGYIFPDTYEFYLKEGADAALKRFIDNFNAKIDTTVTVKIKNTGYTLDEIITISSIVQREAGRVNENGKVASVLFNRLNQKMKLQCDVTIDYIETYVKPYVDNYDKAFTEKYNTYKCEALPAGPICNPGLDTILATIDHPETKYLFFVTDKDMNYYYAETFEQHQINYKNAGVTN
ncbi:hypothetical protein SDC9_131969 [bioreactor metagenome]|uniref:Endolytic murein transglycosylase n=1 Tax=bioreactor metagenome TaxID=1076179 RepID=A0A645D7H0_9ZZZZ